MLDGARACWLGARRTEKSGDWWLLRYGRFFFFLFIFFLLYNNFAYMHGTEIAKSC